MPSDVLCGMAQALQRCMAPLMQLEGDDVLEVLLLESTDNEPMASLTPAEEASLLGRFLNPKKLG